VEGGLEGAQARGEIAVAGAVGEVPSVEAAGEVELEFLEGGGGGAAFEVGDGFSGRG